MEEDSQPICVVLWRRSSFCESWVTTTCEMDSPLSDLIEAQSAIGFDLPVAPAWFSDPPKGTMEDGIRLSIAILETVKNRPEIFEERARQRVDVEFVM